MTESPDQDPTPTPDPKEKAAPDPVRRTTFIVLIVVVLLVAWYLRADRVAPYTSQARVHAPVVPVAAEVSGRITGVFVSNNQPVVTGQELFQIDIENYRLGVQTARASYDAALQALGAAEAGVEAAEAQVNSARANVVRARQDAERMRAIREQDPGAVSQRQVDSTEASLKASEAQLSAAVANREAALQNRGDPGDENSRVQQAQAAIDQALLSLERATVRAPEDGVVTDVRLDKGNFAAAGAPQLSFIPTNRLWVRADFTENNLGHIRPGAEAAIVFDALPGQVVKGTVREIGFGVAVDTAPLGSLPTIANDSTWLRSAQRYPVLIDFELANGTPPSMLKVGSQASVVVYTGEHWIINALAGFWVWLVSILTYAY